MGEMMLTWEKMIIVKGKVEWRQYDTPPQYENDRDSAFLERRRRLQEKEE
jgi:hypothetical protein